MTQKRLAIIREGKELSYPYLRLTGSWLLAFCLGLITAARF